MNKQPKIIFTVTNDLVHDQRMIRICTTLTEAGYLVQLVGRQLRNSKKIVNQPFLQKRLTLIFESGKLFYIEYNFRLFLYLLLQRFDAICSIDLDTAVPGVIISRLRGKTHFFDAHELFPHVPEVARRPQIQKIWQTVEKWVFSKTHVAYTVGNALAKYFQQQYNRPVYVIRNMPLPRTSKPDFWPVQLPIALKTQPFLLYQGALNEGRGLEILINALPSLSIPLVLVGHGDIADKLKQQCLDLNLKNVYFTGYILPQQLPALAQYAWLGINVSENAGLSYFLSLNNKFFDYAQDQLPSLINPFPEYLHLLQEFQTGITCEAETNQIIQAIQTLQENSILYQQLKQNCIKAGAIWHWNAEKQYLINLYQSYLPVV
ncbi:MAG: glycosyltransferase [Bacteroidota bacterium]